VGKSFEFSRFSDSTLKTPPCKNLRVGHSPRRFGWPTISSSATLERFLFLAIKGDFETAANAVAWGVGRFIDRGLRRRVCFLWVAAFLVTIPAVLAQVEASVLAVLAVTPAAPFP